MRILARPLGAPMTTFLTSMTMILSAAVAVEGAEDSLTFKEDIFPFIQKSCVECHGPAYRDDRGRLRRPKANLRLDGKEFILLGGENNDSLPNLTPGDPDRSAIYTTVILPLSDHDHMPPEDTAEELTDLQKEMLRRWIAEGADFGGWTGETE